ncbi:hypothetical protein FA95DRAFT_1662767, partial [Auriscalpium vulgare]
MHTNLPAVTPEVPRWVYSANIRRNVPSEEQPNRDATRHIVLAADVNINGETLFALFDSGSTTNGISPEAATVSRVGIFELTDPMTLQLGVVGSKSKINYGTRCMIGVNGQEVACYLDVANIDHYDIILGTPFLHGNRVALDFGDLSITINGQRVHRARIKEEGIDGIPRGLPTPNDPEDQWAQLRQRWMESEADLMCPVPPELPPFREVNHRINLIDEKLRSLYHLPRCPDSLKPQLMLKIKRYVEAGWWEMRTAPQAAPLLCIPK